MFQEESVAHVFEAALMLSQGFSLFLAGFKGNKKTRPGWSGALGNYRGPVWFLGHKSWLLKYMMDAFPELRVLAECSLVCDVMTF